VLLASAGLLLRGVTQARVLDPGFRVDAVAIASIEEETTYDEARSRALLADLTAELRRARVSRFGFVTNEPFGDSSSFSGMRLPNESVQQTRTIEFLRISPGYFATLGIPILDGRDFVDGDERRNVVIVNQTMARQNWPDGRVVGQTFYGTGDHTVLEIVGVVADSHVAEMRAIQPLMFLPPGEHPQQDGRLPRLLFSTDDPSAVATVATAAQRIDPGIRVEITALRDRLEDWLGGLSLAPLMASTLGGFALGVATVGMLGVFSFAVRQRTREIGIRIALGASAREVIGLVLVSNSKAVIAGLCVGGIGAMAASLVLRSALFGVSPLDPIAYGGVMLVFAAAACAASYVPARRAMRIDPVRALRYE
jgi:hypothetical protein